LAGKNTCFSKKLKENNIYSEFLLCQLCVFDTKKCFFSFCWWVSSGGGSTAAGVEGLMLNSKKPLCMWQELGERGKTGLQKNPLANLDTHSDKNRQTKINQFYSLLSFENYELK